ncbi:hypothetical protein HYW55_00210 [Candidatus Gottesmanbacteria bacterium]|nr:hypothetical protein [Candidatus Gottesmanbacteria bacterium]
MKRISRYLLIVFVGVAFAAISPGKVEASTFITGHTYVKHDGLTKFLKNVELRWTIVRDTDTNKACPLVDNWYRIVKSGDKFSYTFLPDGSKPNPPTTPAPPPNPTPTPKRYPAARVNCKKEAKIPSPEISRYKGQNPDYTCKTNSDGLTYDSSDTSKINFVFQRTDCFGCRHQKATLKVGPPPASELPDGVSTQGHWEFRDDPNNPLCKTDPNDQTSECVVLHDDQGNAYLRFTDIANNDKFTKLDFEWIADVVPTATPTTTPPPQCGAPCTTPGPNSTECPEDCSICAPGDSGNICQAPSGTPTPTPTAVQCGGPCSSDDECDEECPICYTGANGSICAAPTATPTLAPPTATVQPSATPTPFCECDGIDVSASSGFTTGAPLAITGYGKVSNPAINKAEVLNMEYTLKRDGSVAAQSGTVTAVGPTVIPDPPAWRYASTWSTTIPGPGSYRIEEKINCGYRTSSNPLAFSPRMPEVLAASTVNQPPSGIFGFFASLFSGIFGSSQTKTQSTPLPTDTPTPTPFDPLSSDALKLGTFNPLDGNITYGCTWAEFTVTQ